MASADVAHWRLLEQTKLGDERRPAFHPRAQRFFVLPMAIMSFSFGFFVGLF